MNIRSKVNGLVIDDIPYVGVVVDLEKGKFAERINGQTNKTAGKPPKADKKSSGADKKTSGKEPQDNGEPQGGEAIILEDKSAAVEEL